MNMKQAYFYLDVPQDIIDLLNEINYEAISPEQGRQFLIQLNELATKYGLPMRTQHTQVKPVSVNKSVPEEAIKAVNSRVYSSIPRFALMAAKPVVRGKLKAMGLINK